MKILIACDSFKDALAAPAVCEAVARGLRSAVPDLDAVPFPLADGGEGTAELLTHHLGGEWISREVTDPLGRPIRAGFGCSADGRTAFLDLAAASGLQHLREEERNPWLASTFGTGQLLQQALDIGVEEIVLGIGGSATHDAGLGMALALGYRLWAEDGAELAGQGRDLQRLHRIDASQVHPRLREVKIITLTDVNNPLVGSRGAARVYPKASRPDRCPPTSSA